MLFGVGIGRWRRREFACVLSRLFACGEVADDDFTVAFEREESVGEVVAVMGEDLSGERAPCVEVLCGDRTLLRGGDGERETEKGEEGEISSDDVVVQVGHGSPW